mgnify:CR=1 FL=1
MSSIQRYRTIVTLALPIIGGMLSQSLLNLVDAAMVGSLGETALAGVGLGSYANFVIISLIIGLSSGVQAMVARRQGQQLFADAARPVNSGIVLSILIALPISILAIIYSEPLIQLMSSDQDALRTANQYFDYRTAAMVAVGINLSFRGWWNGTHRPGIYLKNLLLMHLLNILISYGLIFGAFGLPEMGAPGAGLGTAIALSTGCLLNGIMVWRDARSAGFMQARSGISSFRTLTNLSLPHSLQQFLFAISISVLFWIIGMLGTEQQAIAHVLINLALFLILPCVGLGIASTTLVSRELGLNKTNDAAQWGWDICKLAFIAMMLLSLPMWIIPDQVLAIFLQDTDTIAQARLPLQLTGIAICLDAAAIVLTQALLGAGANRTVMLVSTSGQWLFFLPLAWLAGPYMGFGLLGIWLIQILHRSLSSIAFILIWQRRRWVHINF